MLISGGEMQVVNVVTEAKPVQRSAAQAGIPLEINDCAARRQGNQHFVADLRLERRLPVRHPGR